EIIIVDDDSPDGTAAVARDLATRYPHVRCIRRVGRRGLSGACVEGMMAASAPTVAVMDADGQHDAHDIPRLLEVVQNGQSDVALGSRFLGRMEYRADPLRRFGVWVFRQVASLTFGRRITDPTSGFQAINTDVLRFFAWDNYPSDYPDTDVLMSLHLAGFRVLEVPVTMRERYSGVSMHTNWRAVYYVSKMFLSILVVLLRFWTRSSPRRAAGPAGEKARG
ncbi:MAG: glycosyltransferase, partial [Chloroflexi bacterium]|nr:glycosyltransferase [Chloroflexota bacterium]